MRSRDRVPTAQAIALGIAVVAATLAVVLPALWLLDLLFRANPVLVLPATMGLGAFTWMCQTKLGRLGPSDAAARIAEDRRQGGDANE